MNEVLRTDLMRAINMEDLSGNHADLFREDSPFMLLMEEMDPVVAPEPEQRGRRYEGTIEFDSITVIPIISLNPYKETFGSKRKKKNQRRTS